MHNFNPKHQKFSWTEKMEGGDRDRTGDIQFGKLAFYFPEIHKSFKFSRLPIIAILSIS
jgi:hypothetical protein